ncbi:unnamed protein product [Allacma fusca]|uniref:Methyltransferase domain-containing protein n=1 Tax=Allacma fusca TaxID=39272 RepID=A0A8J2JE41_9HEXA|nr:unnamed protein product [Allacma fusca]
MAKLEEVQGALETLRTFLTPAIPFVNSHLNSFFMDSLWDYHLSEKLREDLDALTIPEIQSVVKSLASGKYCESSCTRNSISFDSSTFQEIVSQIGRLLLASKHLSVPVKKFKLSSEKDAAIGSERQQDDPVEGEPEDFKWSSWKFDSFMSSKKMHEVEVMSDFIAKVADLQSIHSVKDIAGIIEVTNQESTMEVLIDVGSGKGYLSSFLVLLYNFNVLALDSSSVNTYGCTKRSTTLQKNWSSFLRRARERQIKQDGEISKRGKHWKSKRGEIKAGDDGGISRAEIKVERGTSESCGMIASVETGSASDMVNDGKWSCEKLKTVTLFVNEDLDLLQLLHDNFPYDEVTRPSFGIIGLHTCGQLGVDSIKLFCNSKHAKFLVNVPCCYHLLNEQFHKNEDFSGRKYIPSFEEDTPGFPLSQCLQAESFYLGRNARMMSAQSLHRMSVEEDELSVPRPLLYRALLQVLIRQKLGHTDLENSVGRLGSKFEDFHQYVRKAWTKLKLENVPVSTEEIEALYQTHGAQRERFHKYFLLRALFAPLIEGCILLDRLAYLLEQGDVHEAFIVELFDPFLSPRCHALVAVR